MRCARCAAVTLHDGPTVRWLCCHPLALGLARDIFYILTCKMRRGDTQGPTSSLRVAPLATDSHVTDGCEVAGQYGLKHPFWRTLPSCHWHMVCRVTQTRRGRTTSPCGPVVLPVVNGHCCVSRWAAAAAVGLTTVAPTRSVSVGSDKASLFFSSYSPGHPGSQLCTLQALLALSPGLPPCVHPRCMPPSACPSHALAPAQWPARRGGSHPVGLPPAPSLGRLRGAPPSLAPAWAARARPGRPRPP